MQFAVKKLTRSDLTFFEHQFRRQNAGNQESMNLNANVFVDLIFPYARTIAAGSRTNSRSSGRSMVLASGDTRSQNEESDSGRGRQ